MREYLEAQTEIIPGFEDEKIESLETQLQVVDGSSDVLILHLMGYVDTYNSKYFERKVFKAINTGFVKLIFNCAELTYLSSTGIGAFVEILKAVRRLGGEIVLMNMIPRVFEVFKLLGFSSFFNTPETLEEALNFFTRQSEFDSTGPFPKVFKCPICSKKLRAPREGRFRCSECKTILAIDKAGKVLLG